MNTLLLIWLLLASATVFAAPQARCDAPNHDFGAMPGDATVRHVFHVSNAGDGLLNLKIASACCGARAELSADLLAPSETAEVVVAFTLAGRSGAVGKTIYLATGDPAAPYLRLHLSGSVSGAPSSASPAAVFSKSSSQAPAVASVASSTSPAQPAIAANRTAAQAAPRAETIPQGAPRAFPAEIVLLSDISTGAERIVRLRAGDDRVFKVLSVALRGIDGQAEAHPGGHQDWIIRLRGLSFHPRTGPGFVDVTTDHPARRHFSIPIRLIETQTIQTVVQRGA